MVPVGCDVRLIKLVSSSQPMDRPSHPSTLSSSSGVQCRHLKRSSRKVRLSGPRLRYRFIVGFDEKVMR